MLLSDLVATSQQVARTSGRLEKIGLLAALLGRVAPAELEIATAFLCGVVRQPKLGIGYAGVHAATPESAAESATLELSAVDRAFEQIARLAGKGSADGKLRLLRELLLAQSAEDAADAVSRLGRAALEFKLDGARVQLHKRDDEVKVYSRSLKDVTAAVPELVERVRALPARELILDGETIALRADGTPQPFQTTMRRFGRRLEVDRLRRELPLTPFFFDLLYLDGQPLLDEPEEQRFAALSKVTSGGLLVPRTVTAAADEAQAFLEQALARGHEGIMAKALDAPYEAGGRGQRWLKVKPAHTLDLVVLAAEWGHGRRRGWLSNLHLGARDPEAGGFVMLGKTFKGMTDEMLAWQTKRLLELEIGRDAYTVHVRPELVVEVAFNDVQASPHYPGGLALRFARVKRYRPDKNAAQADTVATVRQILERSHDPAAAD